MARLFDDGSSEYLQVATTPITAAPFAMACWGYPDTDSVNMGAIALVNSGGGNYFILRVNSGGINAVNLRVYDGAGNDCQTSTGITINTWHHMCGVVAAADDRRVFIDGGSKVIRATSHTPTGIDRVSIGIRTSTRHWSGSIAHPAIWDLNYFPGGADAFENYALPHLAAGASPLRFPQGRVAYWPLIDDDKDWFGRYDMTAYNKPGWAVGSPASFNYKKRLWLFPNTIEVAK